jgi:uncharacterized protein with HEPN domain
MPRRDSGVDRINDILDAIVRVETFTDGLNTVEFASDPLVRDAVAWNLDVIGEAAGAVSEAIRRAHPEVPWDRMRGLRNLLVHEYFGIDNEIIWVTVQNDVLPLAPTLRRLLDEDGGNETRH